TLDVLIHPELPGAVVDIVEIGERRGFDATCCGDRRAGRHTASHWAGIDAPRAPARRGALRDREGLSLSARGERQIFPSAKARGLDALDVTVPGQNDFRHLQSLSFLACTNRSTTIWTASRRGRSMRGGEAGSKTSSAGRSREKIRCANQPVAGACPRST